jgi:hypothetical protein
MQLRLLVTLVCAICFIQGCYSVAPERLEAIRRADAVRQKLADGIPPMQAIEALQSLGYSCGKGSGTPNIMACTRAVSAERPGVDCSANVDIDTKLSIVAVPSTDLPNIKCVPSH